MANAFGLANSGNLEGGFQVLAPDEWLDIPPPFHQIPILISARPGVTGPVGIHILSQNRCFTPRQDVWAAGLGSGFDLASRFGTHGFFILAGLVVLGNLLIDRGKILLIDDSVCFPGISRSNDSTTAVNSHRLCLALGSEVIETCA